MKKKVFFSDRRFLETLEWAFQNFWTIEHLVVCSRQSDERKERLEVVRVSDGVGVRRKRRREEEEEEEEIDTSQLLVVVLPVW